MRQTKDTHYDFPAIVFLLEHAEHRGFSDRVFQEARTALEKSQFQQRVLTFLRYGVWGESSCTYYRCARRNSPDGTTFRRANDDQLCVSRLEFPLK